MRDQYDRGRDPVYLPAAKLRDVKPGHLKGVRLRGGYEVVLANVEGTIYAFDAYCPHQGWPLKWGALDRGTVLCALHMWRFDPATGAAVDPPVADCLQTYRVRIEEGIVHVGIDSA